jgi:hypothetical protein
MPIATHRSDEKERVLEYINHLIDSGILNTNFIEYTTDSQGNTQLMIGGTNWKPRSIGGDHYLIYEPRADLIERIGMDIDEAIEREPTTPTLLPPNGGRRRKTRRNRTIKSKKKRTKRYRKK